MNAERERSVEEAREEAAAATEESREATANGDTPQDFETSRDAATSHTSFGDDKVTPRLNDGR